jgi:hypothetical protein
MLDGLRVVALAVPLGLEIPDAVSLRVLSRLEDDRRLEIVKR